jgi:hypothetical protein
MQDAIDPRQYPEGCKCSAGSNMATSSYSSKRRQTIDSDQLKLQDAFAVGVFSRILPAVLAANGTNHSSQSMKTDLPLVAACGGPNLAFANQVIIEDRRFLARFNLVQC